MKKTFLPLLALVGLLISCSKTDPTPVTPPVDKYMNLNAGSVWNYAITNKTTSAVSNYTLTASAKDTLVNGKTYRVVINSDGGKHEYYNITGSDYYTYVSLPDYLGGSRVENLYLKDNAAAGTSWTQSYNIDASGIPVTVTITNKVEERGIAKTVNSIAYTEVIHIITTIGLSSAMYPIPSSALTTNIHSYYAPKSGLIQNDNYVKFELVGFPTQTTDTHTELKSAVLVP